MRGKKKSWHQAHVRSDATDATDATNAMKATNAEKLRLEQEAAEKLRLEQEAAEKLRLVRLPPVASCSRVHSRCGE